MDIRAHLSSWQQLFSATLKQLFSADLYPLLMLVLLPFFIHLFVRKRPQSLLKERWRTRELFDPLQLAFARGIIHPKRYS